MVGTGRGARDEGPETGTNPNREATDNMLRKLFIWLIIGVIVAAIAYGYMTYAVVALYDEDTPKVTYMYLVEKPERSGSFFFNHINKDMVEKELAILKARGEKVPWHLKYDDVVNRSVYVLTLDNR